jgi:hypothetical protein
VADEDLNTAAALSAAIWRTRFENGWSEDNHRASLARLVDEDNDEYETELYESASDPQHLLIDRAQRRKAGQWRRWHERRQPS